MAEPFLSEIRIMSFGFPPKGWALCNGQLLPINQNQALFSLLGTTYGGDGRVNFALPNLQGRAPMHMGSGHTLGERGGEQAHTLSISEMPDARPYRAGHRRPPRRPTRPTPPSMLAQSARVERSTRRPTPTCSAMAPNAARRTSAASQAHLNMQPFLDVNFCIALQGIFPSARTEEATMAQPYVGEIRMFAGNFAPAGWMFCEAAPADLGERDAVQPDRHHLRRRRSVDLRAARPARPRPAPLGQRLHPGRDRRRGDGHADRRSRSRPTRHPLLATGTTRPRPPPRPACRAGRRRASHVTPYGTDAPLTTLSRRSRSARRAAASRTATSSRTCASTSSSRCSASSRAQT